MRSNTADELPPDALPIVWELALCAPSDSRLVWLLAELLNGSGEVIAAHELMQGLADLGCTTLLVSEIGQSAGRYSLHGVEEAIVDGVLLLGNARRQGDILRILQVVKMRGTSHSRAQYVMELTPIGLLMAPHLKGGRQET